MMKKFLKRFGVLTLVLTLIVSCINTAVFAENPILIHASTTLDGSNLTVSGSINPASAKPLKLAVYKSGSETALFTAETTSLSDGTYIFEKIDLKGVGTYSYRVSLAETKNYSNLWSDDFSTLPTTTNYIVAQNLSLNNGTLDMTYGTTYSRILKSISFNSGSLEVSADFNIKIKSRNDVIMSICNNSGNAAITLGTDASGKFVLTCKNTTKAQIASYSELTWYNLKVTADASTGDIIVCITNKIDNSVATINGYTYDITTYTDLNRAFNSQIFGTGVEYYLDNLQIQKMTIVPAPEYTAAEGSVMVEESINASYTINGNSINVCGSVLPASTSQIELKLFPIGNTEAAYVIDGTTNQDGTFAFLNLPIKNGAYNLKISKSNKKVLWSDAFQAQPSSENYTLYSAVLAEGIGNSAPSIEISGSKRLLKTISTLTNGVVEVSSDFMISSTNSGDIGSFFQLVDSTGTYPITMVSAYSGGELRLRSYVDSNGAYTSTPSYTTIGGYTPDNWFNLKLIADMDNGTVKAYLNNEYIATLSYDKLTINNICRPFNSQGVASSNYYIDNLKISQKTTATAEKSFSFVCGDDETNLFSDSFTTLPTIQDGYAVAAGITASENNGICLKVGDESNARIIKTLNDMTSGIIVVSADVMLEDYNNRYSVFRFADTNGTYTAFSIGTTVADEGFGAGKFVARTYDYSGDSAVATNTELTKYEAGKWYNIKNVIYIDDGLIKCYIDGNRVGAEKKFTFNKSNLSNINRIFDSLGDSSAFYIKNLIINKDNAYSQIDFDDMVKVTNNITLPSETLYGADIVWGSSYSSTVTTEGHVIRPSDFVENIKLTASFDWGGTSISRDYFISVLGIPQFLCNGYLEKNYTQVSDCAAGDYIAFNVLLGDSRTNVTEPLTAEVILAVYQADSHQLIGISTQDVYEVRDELANVRVVTCIPSGEKCIVKAYVWKNFNGIEPLTNINTVSSN